MSHTEKVVIPYSFEAEQAVLGGLVLDNDKWDDISPILSKQNFHLSEHKSIFKIISRMMNNNQQVDLLTLDRAVKEAGLLEKNGSIAYLKIRRHLQTLLLMPIS